MKNSVSWVLQSIVITLFVLLTLNIINLQNQINKANEYHQICIAELQASNFSSQVITKYTSNTDPYVTTITNRTVDNGSLTGANRIYEVKTVYQVSMPIINYSTTKTLVGYAK